MDFIIPKVPAEYNREAMKKLIDLLSDPTRARIYFETLLHGEVSTKHLLQRITISRSTLSHHLSTLVREGILEFRVDVDKRPFKVFSPTKEFKAPVLEPYEKEVDDLLFHSTKWFEHTIMELQTFVSIATTVLNRIRKEINKKNKTGEEPETFIETLEEAHRMHVVHILTKEEAVIWQKMYLKFLEKFEAKLQLGGDHRYVSFSGLLPLVIGEPESDPTV